MQARMKNPAFILPDAMKGIRGIFKAVNQGGVSHELQVRSGSGSQGPTYASLRRFMVRSRSSERRVAICTR